MAILHSSLAVLHRADGSAVLTAHRALLQARCTGQAPNACTDKQAVCSAVKLDRIARLCLPERCHLPFSGRELRCGGLLLCELGLRIAPLISVHVGEIHAAYMAVFRVMLLTIAENVPRRQLFLCDFRGHHVASLRYWHARRSNQSACLALATVMPFDHTGSHLGQSRQIPPEFGSSKSGSKPPCVPHRYYFMGCVTMICWHPDSAQQLFFPGGPCIP